MPMAGIVRPCVMETVAKSAIAIESVVESIVVEEDAVHKQPSSKPVEAPAPSAIAAESTKIRAEIHGRVITETIVRIIEVRIGAIRGRAPNISGIVLGRVDHFRIGRLNCDGLLVAVLRVQILFHGNLLLGIALEPAVRSSRGAHGLNCIHDVGLLIEEGVA